MKPGPTLSHCICGQEPRQYMLLKCPPLYARECITCGYRVDSEYPSFADAKWNDLMKEKRVMTEQRKYPQVGDLVLIVEGSKQTIGQVYREPYNDGAVACHIEGKKWHVIEYTFPVPEGHPALAEYRERHGIAAPEVKAKGLQPMTMEEKDEAMMGMARYCGASMTEINEALSFWREHENGRYRPEVKAADGAWESAVREEMEYYKERLKKASYSTELEECEGVINALEHIISRATTQQPTPEPAKPAASGEDRAAFRQYACAAVPLLPNYKRNEIANQNWDAIFAYIEHFANAMVKREKQRFDPAPEQTEGAEG